MRAAFVQTARLLVPSRLEALACDADEAGAQHHEAGRLGNSIATPSSPTAARQGNTRICERVAGIAAGASGIRNIHKCGRNYVAKAYLFSLAAASRSASIKGTTSRSVRITSCA